MFRLRAGFNQAELAAQMGLRGRGKDTAISRLERGDIIDPRLSTISRYLLACGVRFEEFAAVLPAPKPPEVKLPELSTRGFLLDQALRVQRITAKQAANYRLAARYRFDGPAAKKSRARTRKGLAKFLDYRLQDNVIETAVKNRLGKTDMPLCDQVGYLMLARWALGILRRNEPEKWEQKLARLPRFVAENRMNPQHCALVIQVVVERYRPMMPPRWEQGKTWRR